MKKIIFALLLVAVLVSVAPVTCRVNGYESVVIDKSQVFCKHVENLPDLTIMTVQIRLLDVVSNPALWKYWTESFDNIPYISS